MCAIPQLVSAPLNPIPTVEHFRRSHPQCEHSYGQTSLNSFSVPKSGANSVLAIDLNWKFFLVGKNTPSWKGVSPGVNVCSKCQVLFFFFCNSS